MEFHIQSSYLPKGDQPKAIKEITESFQKGDQKVTLVGVTGSGKTFTMANVIENLKIPTLVMCHNKTLAAQLYREFKEFFPNNAIEYFVSYYDYYQPEAYVSSKDLYIEKDLSINDEIDKLRLKATSSLLERDDVIIISSVSCIYGLGSPEDYYNMAFSLKIGQSIDRDEVVKNLIKVQYERNDIDFSRGKFRVKGDILELFPSYLEYGIRVEFFGDEVEAISQIDPLSGKILLKMEKVYVYPAKHFVTEPYKIKLATQKIKDELQDRIRYFNSEKKLVESQRIDSRTNYDIEMLQEMGYCTGIENYSRHLSGREEGQRPACLIDYFREKFLLIIDESHITVPQIRGMYAGDRNRKQNLVDFGFRLPSALDNRPLNFNEFEKLTPYTLYVSATPAEYEIDKSQLQVEQIIRPTGLLDPIVEVRKTKGQLENLYLEMQKRIKVKERILITTLTKKTAEDLSDYLTDLGVKSKYLHSEIDTLERVEIIRDLRRGDYDCIVGINLLREGLDIPEVSLVAILEADKEGFLRNFRSLIQTIGRAARNSNGKAILYADKITDSMKAAIDETSRRRKIQEEYNQKYSITPKTIKKEVKDIIDRFNQSEEKKKSNLTSDLKRKFSLKNYKSENDIKKAIKEEIIQLSKELKFEEAALHRDYAFKYFGGV